MSPKLFIEVDAGKEQPTKYEYGEYFTTLENGALSISFFNGHEFAGVPVVTFLRPIQQQEGLAIEDIVKWLMVNTSLDVEKIVDLKEYLNSLK